MLDLRTQIRTYVDDTIERIDSEDVVATVAGGRIVTRRAPWYLRPAWMAVGAAALVLVAVGLPILLIVNDEPAVVDEPTPTVTSEVTPSTTVTTVAPTVTTASPTTTVPVIPPRLGITWQQAPTQPAFEARDVVHAVIDGGPGLVAVGTAWNGQEGQLGGRTQETVVWTSVDGVTWERIPGLNEQELVLDDVANGPGGLVGVSVRDSVYSHYEQKGPPIWLSPDGATWSRLTGNEDAFGDLATISGIIAGGPGYVAYGNNGEAIHAVIWTSADGLAWTRVEGELGDGYDESTIEAVVSTGSGLVAIGRGGDVGFSVYWEGDAAQGIPRPVSNFLVWTSDDGTNWVRTDLSPEEELPQGTATIDGTTITFGYGGDLRNTMIDLEGGRLATMGYLLTGWANGQRSWAVAWASDDGGVTWFEVTRIGDPTTGGGYAVDVITGEPSGFRDFTVFGDGFVAVGVTGDESTPVWIGAWNEE